MALGKRVRRDSSVEVHLVSDENYFVFQPLLPEVAACGIEPSHILNAIRQLCPHVTFHCASVESIDLQARTVAMVGFDPRNIQTLPFDHLVLCLGMTMDLSRNPGMTEHSLPIKTLGDAFHLRNHVLTKLEQAEFEPDDQARRKALTFVAVGGGFSGVETIAELNDMIRTVLRYYPKARAMGPRVVLVHSRDHILNELDDGLARFAEKKLRQRGVEIILNRRVKEATACGLTLSDDSQVEAETIVCTVGNAPHPLILNTTLPHERGRLIVDDKLRVEGVENVWALGDGALVPDVKRGGHCPPTAQYATRQGTCAASNIVAEIRGRPLKPFTFGGLGQLAIVGHHAGVAQVMGIKLSGLIAWLLWRSVYWMKLPGIRCKLRVGIDWALDVLFPRDITKIEIRRTERLHHAHYRAGEDIIREGEVGDRFYVIESGEVEVLQSQPDSGHKRVAVRGAGESFGEVALVSMSRRTATVRCLTPVDVLTFSRRDFQSLMGSYAVLRKLVEEDVKRRAPKSDTSVGEPSGTSA